MSEKTPVTQTDSTKTPHSRVIIAKSWYHGGNRSPNQHITDSL